MKRNQNSIFSTRSMVIMAALIALQIILSRYLAIQVSPTLRISFETIPLALAGMWMGPLAGVIVAVVSDILGTFIYGYGVWFPPIVLGPAIFAAMCGWGTKYIFRSSLAETKDTPKVVAMTVVAGLINAFVIGVFTTTLYSIVIGGAEFTFVDLVKATFDGTVMDQIMLSVQSGKFATVLSANFISRLTTKPIVIVACSLLVALINRSVYRPVISRIVRRGAV